MRGPGLPVEVSGRLPSPLRRSKPACIASPPTPAAGQLVQAGKSCIRLLCAGCMRWHGARPPRLISRRSDLRRRVVRLEPGNPADRHRTRRRPISATNVMPTHDARCEDQDTNKQPAPDDKARLCCLTWHGKGPRLTNFRNGCSLRVSAVQLKACHHRPSRPESSADEGRKK